MCSKCYKIMSLRRLKFFFVIFPSLKRWYLAASEGTRLGRSSTVQTPFFFSITVSLSISNRGRTESVTLQCRLLSSLPSLSLSTEGESINYFTVYSLSSYHCLLSSYLTEEEINQLIHSVDTFLLQHHCLSLNI